MKGGKLIQSITFSLLKSKEVTYGEDTNSVLIFFTDEDTDSVFSDIWDLESEGIQVHGVEQI